MDVAEIEKRYRNEPVNVAENVVRTRAGVVDVKPLEFSASASVLISIVSCRTNNKFMRLR